MGWAGTVMDLVLLGVIWCVGCVSVFALLAWFLWLCFIGFGLLALG